MEKKNQICLLFVAFLIIYGIMAAPMHAQQPMVTVDPAQTSATVTWPTDETAASYQIDIYKSGTVFCHLTLGPTGQLLAITFNAPQRNQHSEAVPSVLSFMVTGLDEATRYNYVLSALDANGTPLHVYIGAFATTGYSGPQTEGGLEVIPTPPVIPGNPEAKQGIDQTTNDRRQTTNTQKLLKDGQLNIMYKGRMYDVQGNQLK